MRLTCATSTQALTTLTLALALTLTLTLTLPGAPDLRHLDPGFEGLDLGVGFMARREAVRLARLTLWRWP